MRNRRVGLKADHARRQQDEAPRKIRFDRDVLQCVLGLRRFERFEPNHVLLEADAYLGAVGRLAVR